MPSESSPYLSSNDVALTQLHTGSFTIAFGLNITATSPFVAIDLLVTPAIKISLQTDGHVRFTVNDSLTNITSFVISAVPVSPGWNSVVAFYDLNITQMDIIVNLQHSRLPFYNPANSLISQFVSDFQIGTSGRAVSGNTPGSFAIDEVTVWGRALSNDEISQIYGSASGNWQGYPFIGGAFNLVFQGLLTGDIEKPLLVANSGIWSISQSFDSSTQDFVGTLSQIFQGATPSLGFSWVAENFSDKVLFAQHDNPAQYWIPGTPTTQVLPGLPSSKANWDGVSVFADHALLWSGDTLQWSDVNDFTNWIPVAVTAVSAVLTLNKPFIQPPVGGTVSVSIVNTAEEVVSISLTGNLSFPDTAVGSTNQELLTIVNTGTTDLVVTGVSLPPGFTTNFTGATIVVGGAVPVLITFTPVATQNSYDGSVIVASNATLGTSTFPISGNVLGNNPTIFLSGQLNFGIVYTGQTPTTALVINNRGNATLTISSISVPAGVKVDTVAIPFSPSNQITTFPATIAAGAAAVVSIKFLGTVSSVSGNIIVTSNAANTVGNTSAIPVSGSSATVVGPNVFVTDWGYSHFGAVAVGSSATSFMAVFSEGVNPLGPVQISAIQFPPGFTTSAVLPIPINIPAGSEIIIPVTFTPTAAQSYDGTITLTASGNGAPGFGAPKDFTLQITGQGQASGKIISLTGDLAFGSAPTGGEAFALLTITNKGTNALTVSSIAYPVGFSGAFAGVIAPGKSQNVQVSFNPTSAIQYSGNLTVNSNADSGVFIFPVSGTGFIQPQPATLVADQIVSMADVRNGVTYYNYYTVVSATASGLVLTLMDLTGITTPGFTMPVDGRQFFTLDANEAGQTVITGAKQNGPIFRIIPQGDYAYCFKERSIQSIQYTGIGNGVFFIHNEVSGEGLISREAICDRQDGTMIFLGHRELYAYQGGPNIVPVCQQTTRQLYKDLDRSRLDVVRVFHNEGRKEIWVQYPIIGGFKVLIWNYIEDSSTIDDYNPLVQFTGLGQVDWLTNSSSDNGGLDHVPLLANADGNLRIHGQVYTRDGRAYVCTSETMDYDLGAPDNWKYVDAIILGLDVKVRDTVPRYLNIQVGSQASLSGAAITWTAPQQVRVDGAATIPVKVNPGGAGRYLRVRFTSSDPNVQWRISSFEIATRAGGLY